MADNRSIVRNRLGSSQPSEKKGFESIPIVPQVRPQKAPKPVIIRGKEVYEDLKKADMFPVSSDRTQWRALIIGPKSSPFEDGNFILHFKFPFEYPEVPSKVGLHKNVIK
eukprot:GHVP01027238.1.p1 GENE.GHVP01027238.1~~GHVP01027238.1.p1  ORF type:complete len:110 (+),score=9.35 GHVP01027238.1:154-483(+)